MTHEPSLNLSPQQFAAAFPFHVVLDGQLRVLQLGSALRRLCPGMVEGEFFADHFRVQRPAMARMDVDALRHHAASLFVLQHLHAPLRLRGEMVPQPEGSLFFLGSPWVTDMAEVSRLGLGLSDFAVHDPVSDLLFLLQTKNKALADAQELSRRLRQQQDSLREATRAAEAAEQASRMKSEFLAVMSHEIRTPLNGVLGMLNYLLAGRLSHQQRDCASTALKSGKTLLGIINGILDFSKVEAGKLELEHVDFSLRRVVGDAVEMVAFQASDKGLAIDFDMAAEAPDVLRGDPTRIRQVLVNYLANAVKFTSAGKVSIRISTLDETDSEVTMRLEVHDTGIGIPLHKQRTLFEPFSQADASTTRRYGGTGLGLAICKKLAGLMGGEVGVRSEPGQGSVFWLAVRLDKGRLSPLPRPASDRTLQRFEGRVLLCDDEPVNQLVAQLHLEALGASVDVVDHGEAAIESVRRTRYDLVLLDMQMPDMDGIQACQLIRSERGVHASPPIVIWTASMLAMDPTHFKAAGADDVLAKPFEPEELKQLLSKFLAKAC
ncbi:ATP-binding protein [Ideonella sp. YS5]|uniref:ATP-binding protein n=1 Tax=Ideonella sp. YS5 TaxID=3453714 RepID=UPI003EE980B5